VVYWKYGGGERMAEIKQQVINVIHNLPDDVSLGEIMAELYFRLQVDACLEKLNEGKGITD
jgi:hypothetical protein